jgi:hypothetical protein
MPTTAESPSHVPSAALWTDRRDAQELLRRRLDAGRIDGARAALLERFIRDGAVELPGAVQPDLADEVTREFGRAFSGGMPGVYVEHFSDGILRLSPAGPELEHVPAKLLDLHGFSAPVRRAVLSPALRDFLELVLDGPGLAFQSLGFTRGTEQPAHRDTLYVHIDAPMALVATWIALEDVVPGSGELEYYAGSHRVEVHARPARDGDDGGAQEEHLSYLASLRERAVAAGHERRTFLGKKGDALVWAATLLHGGSKVHRHEQSRRSLVTHYCPAARRPLAFDLPHVGPLDAGGGWLWSYQVREAPAGATSPPPPPPPPGAWRRLVEAAGRAIGRRS